MLHKQQTTVSYADRLPTKIGLYISDEIKNNTMQIASSGNTCDGHTYPMNFGSSLADAIQTGVETSVDEVVVLHQMPNSGSIQSQGLKFVIIPRLTNANGDISFSAAFLSNPSCKGTFQASVTCSLMDIKGKTFYSFTANGTGLNSGSATCPDGAAILAKATETALQQIADNIAQMINSSSQIKDALK